MKFFSQRTGLTPVSDIIQIASMNDELRNGIWNVLDVQVWSAPRFMRVGYGKEGEIHEFGRRMWTQLLKAPADQRPHQPSHLLAAIREHYFSQPWNGVYDFVEFVLRVRKEREAIASALNKVLAVESAGYQIIENMVTEVTSAQELETLSDVLSDDRFSGPQKHLRRALEMMSDRLAPDYRNSIKESISAVESMARLITGDAGATLPEALKSLERNGKLHGALKDGFVKLYGYTSDEAGIRHAMLDDPNLSLADARFFVVSCGSFVNYLKSLM